MANLQQQKFSRLCSRLDRCHMRRQIYNSRNLVGCVARLPRRRRQGSTIVEIQQAVQPYYSLLCFRNLQQQKFSRLCSLFRFLRLLVHLQQQKFSRLCSPPYGVYILKSTIVEIQQAVQPSMEIETGTNLQQQKFSRLCSLKMEKTRDIYLQQQKFSRLCSPFNTFDDVDIYNSRNLVGCVAHQKSRFLMFCIYNSRNLVGCVAW